MDDTSLVIIVFLVTTTILFLAATGRRIRLRIERRGLWLAWERVRRE